MPISLTQTLRKFNRLRLLRRQARRAQQSGELHDYARWVAQYDTLDDMARARLLERAARLSARPLISVLMPVHDPEPAWLDEAIRSVRAQLYDHWELCIADDASSDPRVRNVLARHAAADPLRIRIGWRARNGHISVASNTALDMARGDYIALLDHDDRLPEHALLCVAETLARFPHAQVLYSDEDKLNVDGNRCEPYFKSDWNLELFRSQNMVSHLGVYRTGLARAVGGFSPGLEGAQDYDLALRCVEVIEPGQIVHIPHVLYHWRMHPRSTASGGAAKPYAHLAGCRALEAHFRRLGIACDVESEPAGWYRCTYRSPNPPPRVLVVVADSAGPRRLKTCIESLHRQTYAAMDIVIAHASSDVTLPDACNRAIASSEADVVALIDSRCRLHAPDALESLVARACLPEAGAIGVKLLSTRGRIVGNAQLLGAGGAYVALASQTRAHRGGYFGRARLPQHVSALGEGCVVVRAEHLRKVGWVDASYRDMDAAIVDFTFRLNAYGRRNHWVPTVEATIVSRHWSARRIAAIDAARVAGRWRFAELRDAHYNDNLGPSGRFHYASPPRVSLARPWFEPG
ncbi:glycosyltransferase [Lysobacter sp. KIS68-7]|uniref:glycosyltransferase family 2 protein n=1 Tax=Lysobacter sp. KIS68-7 TaxID=2904252 RepID=UPI001E521031|nr:glycosyltransferase [Lysobacter sp. KIS68-7]UHQ20648.1 glycosyltransferase [Lysobacter sp. KIS68-7]